MKPSAHPEVIPAPSSSDVWNQMLLEHDGHLLQSWEWGAFKSRHGWTPERILVETDHGTGAAQVLYRARGPLSIGYVPRGPVLNGAADDIWPALRRQIDRAAWRNRTIATILEPNQSLRLSGRFGDAGLVQGPDHLQPGRTVRIPLLEDDALLKQMHQKTRYSVRLAERRGVVIERPEFSESAVDAFYGLMQDTATRNEFGIHSREYYRDFMTTFGSNAVLLLARVDDGHLGAALIAARFGTEAIYMYGASSSQHRSHGAAFLLQFEAMRWAREGGCTHYDLWGIPDVDPVSFQSEDHASIAGTKGDDWRGLYRFKTGFGGEILSYPPTLERRHVPVLPWLARRVGAISG